MSVAEAAAPLVHGPICVLGLWHLGTVTAACLAEAGYDVIGADPDAAVVAELREGRLPVFEPGLAELIEGQRAAGHLRFATDAARAVRDATVVWVTFDTPVDDEDRADVASVLDAASTLLTEAAPGTLVVISSQLPVGSVRELESRCAARRGAADLALTCVPENLRLGSALESFRRPDRIVAGTRNAAVRDRMAALLSPFCDHVEWMGVESAEMTKHAINSFLATSVTFINEISTICEQVGADAAEVARGLKSERRIGPRAYLSPGDAFAGGTLARDIAFLREQADRGALPTHLLAGVQQSNDVHKNWVRRTLANVLDVIPGRRVALWGLTYKPGTDTLRRSGAIALCSWLLENGATVRLHDPVVRALPDHLAAHVQLADDALRAAAGAEALVLCTPWPEYRAFAARDLLAVAPDVIVIDAGGFLKQSLGGAPEVRYVQVGSAWPALKEQQEGDLT